MSFFVARFQVIQQGLSLLELHCAQKLEAEAGSGSGFGRPEMNCDCSKAEAV